MDIKGRIIIVASIVTCFLIQAQGADKYTDGNRPYEFGFSIDGEQHRHEKKDEKGLIEGEFGFITADGVYHVTVYATDEQGRFKILSMKNIRVKPYPTYTAKQSNTPTREGHSRALPASVQTPAPSAVATTTFKPIKIQPPANSCSHCSVPTTSTPAPVFIPPISNNPNQISTAGIPKFPQGVKPQLAFGGQPNGANSSFPQPGGQPNGANSPFAQPGRQPNGANGPFAQPGGQPNSAHSPFPAPSGVATGMPQQAYTPPQILNRSQFPSEQGLVPQQDSQSFPQQGFRPGQSSPSNPNDFQGPGSGTPALSQQQPQTPNSPVTPQNNNPISGSQGPNSAQYPGVDTGPARENIASGRTPKRLDGAPSIGPAGSQPNSLQRGLLNSQSTPALPAKPTLISAQMQIVDKNTDIYRRGPGENEGLPEGLTKDDMTQLLYTFNYTVGFHGHFEEGYTNGVKQGYYYVTGRNGVRTRVDYVADSKGFRPKISQEVLDLLSDDVPKPDTEKEERFGLKGYEFKWLYYPVEAKGL